jgi:hypothetical protein
MRVRWLLYPSPERGGSSAEARVASEGVTGWGADKVECGNAITPTRTLASLASTLPRKRGRDKKTRSLRSQMEILPMSPKVNLTLTINSANSAHDPTPARPNRQCLM